MIVKEDFLKWDGKNFSEFRPLLQHLEYPRLRNYFFYYKDAEGVEPYIVSVTGFSAEKGYLMRG